MAARDVHELIDELRHRGVTIFLTTHRLEEAERLCDRVAILNTTLRTIGRPDELRERLFAKTLVVKTLAPLADPDRVFGGLPAVEGWRPDGSGEYVVDISDSRRRAGGDAGAGPGGSRRALDRRVAALARGRLPPADRRGRRGEGGPDMSATRIRAIFRKELREFRHNGSIVATMAILPMIFLIEPLIQIFNLPASSAATLAGKDPLLYMLGIPALVPAALAAYSVVGEREQGTLEPVLTTPIRREELLLGKALAVLVPALVIAYAVFGLAVASIAVFAASPVASAVLRGAQLLAQVVFTPLLAGWSIWVGMAISARCNDTRVAQQLSVLASLPLVVLAALIAFGVIHVSPSSRSCSGRCCSSSTFRAGGSSH